MDRQIVQEIFDKLKEQGIDPAKQLAWSYYFTDEDSKDRLQAVVPKLEAEGYKFMEIRLAEPGGEPVVLEGRTFMNPPLYALQVQMVESHTMQSLERRNSQLQDFAELNDLFSYDGFSVAPATGVAFDAKRET